MDSNLGGIPGAAAVGNFLLNQIGNGFRLAGQIPRVLKSAPRALVSNPKRLLNPFSARGGLLYGTGIQTFGPGMGLDQDTIDGLDILAGGTSIINLPFLLKGGDNDQDPDRKARRLGYRDAADQLAAIEENNQKRAFIGPPSPDFIGPRVPDHQQASYNARTFANTSVPNPEIEIISPSQEPPTSTLSSETPVEEVNSMQSELLKEATTMRRAKEMKELGITGGDEAMNKGTPMHTWLSTHGELADNLIRDKRMREVRIAREFDRDLPTDARGLDGQMGNFEAFRQMG